MAVSHRDPEPAAAVTLTERIAALLRHEITSGQFEPGDVLPPEHAIAERLGVSRTVLREAVARLKVEGLVASKQGRGLLVLSNRPSASVSLVEASQQDLEEVLGTIELRLGFEGEAAALAAERRDAADLDAMQTALDSMQSALDDGRIQAGVDADFAFHAAIAHATCNAAYQTFFSFLGDLYRRNFDLARQRSSQVRGRGAHSQAEHEAIFAAIRSRDADAARHAGRQHVLATGERMRQAHQLLLRTDPFPPSAITRPQTS